MLNSKMQIIIIIKLCSRPVIIILEPQLIPPVQHNIIDTLHLGQSLETVVHVL